MTRRRSVRLSRLEQAAPRPRSDTPEARAAYCRANGLSEDTVLVGFPGPFVICLRAEEPS